MRILTIVNSRSGQADAGLYDFLRAVGSAGAESTVRFLTGGATLRDLVRDAADFDRVVAAGGDGTVSGICYELRDSKVPILAYPAGTANLLALNLRVPFDPHDLATVALDDCVAHIDLGELDIGAAGDPGRRRTGFVIAAGAGFDASIMEGAEELKQTIGAASYIVSAMQNLAPTVSRFRLTLDGEVVETEGMAVLLVNMAKLQFDLSITHRSDPSDGLLEVVVLRSRNVAQLVPAVWAAIIDRTTRGYSKRPRSLEIHSARHILVEADPPLAIQHDGDAISLSTPFEARVLPGAAHLLVPETYLATQDVGSSATD